MLNHLIGCDGLTLVARVGEASVGEIEGGIDLSGSHRGEGRIHNNNPIAAGLYDATCMEFIALFLYMLEVHCLFLLVL